MLSVALATDQRSSNGWYSCTGQAGLYQPAVKMVVNICSMQIPYSGVVFCVDTPHSISIFVVNFIHSSSWPFPHIDSKKVCTLIKRSVTKFPVISSVQYTLSFITSFFEELFSQSTCSIFYENYMILWYYQIWQKVIWKVHGAWIDGYDSQNKDKNITITKKKESVIFFVQCIIAKKMWFPTLLLLSSWTSSEIFYNSEKQQ